MRLASLLAAMPEEELNRLALNHVITGAELTRPQRCDLLESAIRSPRFVSTFVLNRLPPTFSILTLLLEEPNFELPVATLRERVIVETERIKTLLDNGDLLFRDNGLRIY